MTDEQIQEIIDALQSELESMDPESPEYKRKQDLLNSWEQTLNQQPPSQKDHDDNKYYVP